MKYLGSITDAKDLVTKEYVDGKVSNTGTPYGTCSTAAGTAAKTVTVDSDSFALVTGACVRVKFSSANSVASPTLNVNGTGAKAIMRYGTTAPSTSAASSWNAGSVIDLTYDGTNWVMHNHLNTTYSSMTVAEYEAGTGTTARTITPARLKGAIQHWASDSNTTYSLSKSGSTITLTGSDGSTTSVTDSDSDNNTTYTLATGDSNGQIKVTPSSGSAYNVSVKGLGTAAYTASTAYAPSTHTHDYLPLAGGTLTGELVFKAASSQPNTKGIKWGAFNSKNPYIGYCTSSSDGTFMVGSLEGTTYTTGLSIGGSSGNLLWKGVRVVDASSSQALTNKTYNGYTLGAACAKGVATTVTSGSSSLVTSGAVYSAINDATGFVRAAASARGSASSLSLSASTITKVTLDTWITQTDTAFTFSDGGIKCPYDGVIIVSGSVYLVTSYNVSAGCYIKKGTTEVTSQYIGGASGGISSGSVSLQVSAGDIIYLNARASSATTTIPNNSATHLDISYIQ